MEMKANNHLRSIAMSFFREISYSNMLLILSHIFCYILIHFLFIQHSISLLGLHVCVYIHVFIYLFFPQHVCRLSPLEKYKIMCMCEIKPNRITK